MSSLEADSFPPLVPVPSLPLAAGAVAPQPAFYQDSSVSSVRALLDADRQKYAHLAAFLAHKGVDPIRIQQAQQKFGIAPEYCLLPPLSEDSRASLSGQPVLSVPVRLEQLSFPPAPVLAAQPPVVAARNLDLLVDPAQLPLQGSVGPAVLASAAFGPQLAPHVAVQPLPSPDTGLTLQPTAGAATPVAPVGFEILNSHLPAFGPFSPLQAPTVPGIQPSWSRVVQGTASVEASGSAQALSSPLQFYPPASAEGDVIIRPPQDVLKKGNSLWATSLIGGFLQSRLPFKQVESFAFRAWGGLGLQKVLLHAKGYFVFKFSSAVARDNVLASGPWYVSNKLLLLKHWKEGADFLQDSVHKVPIWVKLHQVPYSYWTSEGLSYLASGIGRPLFLDAMTAKLEPLPYARVCIEIQAGAKLPAKLFATNLDAESGEETLIEVKVEYQSKPQSCGICSSFGHSQFKCPRANFQWVAKSPVASEASSLLVRPPIPSAGLPSPSADSPMPSAGGPSPSAEPQLPSSVVPIPSAGLPSSSADFPMPSACAPSPSAEPHPIPSAGLPRPSEYGEEARCRSNPFSVLAVAASAEDLSVAEPPSWGSLGPPIRSQSKSKKKKKSPKGNKSS